MTTSPQDIMLANTIANVDRQSTPHGVLRTMMYPADQEEQNAHIGVRYDDDRFIFTVVRGEYSETLLPKVLDWQWATAAFDIEYDDYQTKLSEFLNNQLKEGLDGDSDHSIVTGNIFRKVEQGRLLLAWIGTSSLRAYNVEREILPMDVGMNAGELWSSEKGIQPTGTLPHIYDSSLNIIDRLLVYSASLRPAIDELPFVGRSTLERIAEHSKQNGSVYLFDLHPIKVLPIPRDITLNYRWETPTKVNLSWTGSDDASGFIVEEAPNPSFNEPRTIAELTDHRQRVYTISPPIDRDVYYRVIPFNKNVQGIPSTPIIVTPVPLIAPLIENIDWSNEGKITVEWSLVPQADTYELEFSPSQDFDSAQTAIVYRGESTAFEVDRDEQPAGWYFRVRSRNNHFMPELPSIWSAVKRAPHRLPTPTFKSISPSLITWTSIQGADAYQVRQHTVSEDQVIAVVNEARFIPPQDVDAAYEIRAIRVSEDENTASNWSNTVSLGSLNIDDLDTDSVSGKDSDTLPVNPIPVKIKSPEPPAPTRNNFAVIAGIVLMTLIVGLFAGFLGTSQFGIGLDPTSTPLSEVDIQLTDAQEAINRDNQIARATLAGEVSRINIVATENANQINNLQQNNATLQANNQSVSEERNNLDTQLDNAYATATAVVNMQATLQDALLNDMNQTATQNAELIATLEDDVVDLVTTVEALSVTPTPTIEPIFGTNIDDILNIMPTW